MGVKFNMWNTAGLLVSLLAASIDAGSYNIGVGRADITGPAAEIGMMGYAKQGQNTAGIHIRLYSRAYIVEDPETGVRVVFVSADAGMMGQLVKKYAIEKLDTLYPGLYTEQNVAISSTHTHSGPAGFLQYVLFNIPNLGFLHQTMDAMVDGIVESIKRAHESVVPGDIYLGSDIVEDANINRSPTSYEANPEEEKAKYPSNTDKEMLQLQFYSDNKEPLGVLNWFAVHPTSMNNTNHLISGDNKGAASQMMERAMDPDYVTGQGPFVAAFASTNLGDVSPNTKGPKCMDTGLECDVEHSTCDGRVQMCVAFGPGEDMFESTKIIADRQFQVSKKILENTEGHVKVEGSVKFAHQWVDMTKYEVTLDDGSTATTCKAAMGYSFAAGTTDGPGEFDFTQGTTTGNPFWDFISGLLKDPGPETEACHAPKPILLDTGEVTIPYAWHPSIIDTQIIKIGQMHLLAFPGELTTMAGRRLRETVHQTIKDLGEDTVPVVAGLSNTYTHYVATFEEYQKQRYEAASTLYGPHTLRAYQHQYAKLATAMTADEELPAGNPPNDLLDSQISFIPGVVYDHTPGAHLFGDCVQEPADALAGDTVSAKFISGHLRNNLMLDSTYLKVQRLQEDGEWLTVAVDNDWETRLHWHRTNVLMGESEVTITWDVTDETPHGEYRIVHQGHYKHILRGITAYEGASRTFTVGPANKSYTDRQQVNRKNIETANQLAQFWNLFM